MTRPITFSLPFSDWGFELLSRDALEGDIGHCLNATRLEHRRFREVARIAGRSFQGFPGQGKPARPLQVSSELLFDVVLAS